MGTRGYNQRVPEWVAESSCVSFSSPLSSNSLVTDRSWRWIKGRSKPDGNIPNEKTKKVDKQRICNTQSRDPKEVPRPAEVLVGDPSVVFERITCTPRCEAGKEVRITTRKKISDRDTIHVGCC